MDEVLPEALLEYLQKPRTTKDGIEPSFVADEAQNSDSLPLEGWGGFWFVLIVVFVATPRLWRAAIVPSCIETAVDEVLPEARQVCNL